MDLVVDSDLRIELIYLSAHCLPVADLGDLKDSKFVGA